VTGTDAGQGRVSARRFVGPLITGPAGGWRLVNRRNGGILADRLLPALDSASRRTGLLCHQSLPAGTALVLAPCAAIHTFFMRFDIDVAYVSRDGRVLKVRQVLRPWRLSAALGAHAVIEMPAGTLAHSDTRPGDLLQIV
jgi:uncharacterized membrane protein (UPF0127 family)